MQQLGKEQGVYNTLLCLGPLTLLCLGPLVMNSRLAPYILIEVYASTDIISKLVGPQILIGWFLITGQESGGDTDQVTRPSIGPGPIKKSANQLHKNLLKDKLQ